MDHGFYTSEEIERKLAEMKIHQRMEVLLCVDEILSFLDREVPANAQWKATHGLIQSGKRSKPPGQASRI